MRSLVDSLVNLRKVDAFCCSWFAGVAMFTGSEKVMLAALPAESSEPLLRSKVHQVNL